MPRIPPDMSWENAARARRAYAENRPVRAALRRGDVSLATVMREQPGGLADRTLFEILLMAHQFGRRRLCALNARGVEERVNLATTLSVADYATREWVVRNALPHGRKAPRDTWAQVMAD
ncbi:MAG TPA: hypothetical protein VNA28_02475 [Solirubrobacteraceae bacterium]|nr:hypothetical protein [Solirubrobacteraceae bacterium]